MMKILRVCGAGVLGYVFPRILVAAGVPLERWANSIGGRISGLNTLISLDVTLIVIGLFFAIILMTVEFWWSPIESGFKHFTKGNKKTYDQRLKSKDKELYFERNRLYLYELAFLSLGLVPVHGGKFSSEVIARNRKFKEAIRDGFLRAEFAGKDPDKFSEVALEDFAKFAYHSKNEDFISLVEEWGEYHSSDVKSLKNHDNEYDTWLLDAINYVAFGSWNDVRNEINLAERITKISDATNKVIQKICDGVLRVYGTETFSSVPLIPIEKQYWRKYGINFLMVAKNIPEELTTEARTHDRSYGVRRNLKTSKQRVEELWPPKQ